MRVFLASLLCASAVCAEEAYRRAEELDAALRASVAAAEGRARIVEIGKSHAGRAIVAVEIGDTAKPALLVVGGVEADRPAGSELAAALVADLLTAQDERTRALLAERSVFVVARLNPDGAERFFESPLVAHAGTARPWDEDRDGEIDEDGPDDFDRDGTVRWMRVADPAGEWVEDAAEPGFMRQADVSKGERGAWRLFPEGRDDDADGAWNEDGPGGVDLNSNFPWNYRHHAARVGPYQVSEPESRALAEYVLSRPTIEAVFVFSSNDSCVRQFAPARPPEPAPDPAVPVVALDEADRVSFARAAESYRKRLGLDRLDPGPFRDGGLAEWAYFHQGVLALASPGWSAPWRTMTQNLPPEDPATHEERATHRWMMANRKDAWAPWAAVEHPDFPGKKVEVGGWRPFAKETPAPGDLPALALKHGEFVRDVLEAFPKVGVRDAVVTPKGGGLFEVVVTVHNEGGMPTALRHGTRTERARAVRVDVETAGEVLAGNRTTLVPAIAAFGGSKELRWVIKGTGAIRILVETDKAGRAEWKGELK